jgi:hypothetical protein
MALVKKFCDQNIIISLRLFEGYIRFSYSGSVIIKSSIPTSQKTDPMPNRDIKLLMLRRETMKLKPNSVALVRKRTIPTVVAAPGLENRD